MPNPAPCTVMIPDLIAMCPWPIRINPLDHIVSPETIRWLEAPGTLETQEQRVAHADRNAGLLASLCWPELANLDRLQLNADFVNYLFHIDDLTDEMELKDANSIRDAVMGPLYAPEEWKVKIDRGEAHTMSVLIHDIRVRLTNPPPLVQDRFIRFFDRFVVAVTEEAMHRKQYYTPTIAEYEPRRRDNSSLRPIFALLEYSYNLELPVEAWYHPVLRELEDCAHDLVCWGNDILSFGMEYSRGDTWNIVIVVMKEKALSVQEAMDYCGVMCRERIKEFVRTKANLPSWDVEVDRAVQIYVEGLQNWVVGSTEFSFRTKRYFEDGMQVKESRVMQFSHPKVGGVLCKA